MAINSYFFSETSEESEELEEHYDRRIKEDYYAYHNIIILRYEENIIIPALRYIHMHIKNDFLSF